MAPRTPSDQRKRRLSAREYLRVSSDKSGRERSNDEQHADNTAAADAHGWALGRPYRDVGSASRYAANGGARAGFDKLVDDLTHGRFGADVLILWEASRGSRRLSVWAHFLELLEDRGVQLHVTSHGRTYDLSNARDRRSLHEDGTDSEYESAKISTRILRATAANAADGKPHGQAPFGYRRRYDPRDRRLVAQEPHEPEAKIVRDVFDRLAAGHSLRSIARDLAAAGVRGRRGVPFSSETLRNLALNPAYVGKRRHAPRARSGRERRASGTLVTATWAPLVDEATFLAVQHRLTDPARRTCRPGRGKHLLSLIVRCDVCSGPLAAAYRRGVRGYYCQTGGHVRIRADGLDAYATDAVLGLLAEPDRARRLTAVEHDEAAVAAAEVEVERIRAELDELAEELGNGAISASMAARAEAAKRERLEAAIRHRDGLTTPDELGRLIPPGPDAVERWKAAPMSTRREVVRLLFVPGKLGELRVTRSPWRGADVSDRVVGCG